MEDKSQAFVLVMALHYYAAEEEQSTLRLLGLKHDHLGAAEIDSELTHRSKPVHQVVAGFCLR